MSGAEALRDLVDAQAIRDLVENWIVWRDAGDWERFATVWHDDGVMMATWFQGPAREFIRVSREGFERGVRILHFQGGTSVDLAGDRAIAQTKMTITQRTTVEGVECDVVCTGRFYDFFERRDERRKALGLRAFDRESIWRNLVPSRAIKRREQRDREKVEEILERFNLVELRYDDHGFPYGLLSGQAYTVPVSTNVRC